MKYRSTALSWSLALTLVLGTGLAAAQDQTPSSGLSETSPLESCLKRFEALDKKHTGKISKDEFMANKQPSPRAEKIFTSRDLNHDGILTKEEYCMGAGGGKTKSDPAALCKSRFNTLDTNQDGKVSKNEFMGGRKPGSKSEDLFKQKDANGDGTLTPEEFCSGQGKEKPKSQ
jgi:Ca2+-binding EF-hand superfamily protein